MTRAHARAYISLRGCLAVRTAPRRKACMGHHPSIAAARLVHSWGAHSSCRTKP